MIGKKKTQIRAILLSVLILFPLTLTKVHQAEGPLTTENWVTEVANGTLFFSNSSWLININALTPEILAIVSAAQSQSMENEPTTQTQGKILIKSNVNSATAAESGDLSNSRNDGNWFSLENINDVSALTPEGEPVSNAIVGKQSAHYYTKENGLTIDLTSGRSVNPFALTDPYNLNLRPELASLKNQLNILKSNNEKNATDVAIIEKIFSPITLTTEMQKLNKNQEALAKFGEWLISQNSSSAELAQLNKIQAQTKEAIDQLILNAEQEKLAAACQPETTQESGDESQKEDTKSEEETKDKGQPSTDTLKILSDTLQKISVKTQPDSSKESTTSAIEMAKNSQEEVLVKTLTQEYNSAREKLLCLVDLDNITAGRVLARDRENQTLNKLATQTLQDYSTKLTAGESEEYKQSKDQNKKSILQQTQNQIQETNEEILWLVQAIILRSENGENKVATLTKFTNEATNTKGEIPHDDFQEPMQKCVDDLISKLVAIQAQYQIQLTGGTTSDAQKKELAILQNEYRKALDSNDIAKVKQLEAKIAALGEKMKNNETKALTQISQIDKDITKLTNEKTVLYRKKETSTAKKKSATNESDTALQKEAVAVDNEIATISKEISEKEKAISGKKLERNQLQQELSEPTRKKMDAVQTQVDTAKQKIASPLFSPADVAPIEKLVNDLTTQVDSGTSTTALAQLAAAIDDRAIKEGEIPEGLTNLRGKIQENQDQDSSSQVKVQKTASEIKLDLDSAMSDLKISDAKKTVTRLITLNELATSGNKACAALLKREMASAVTESPSVIKHPTQAKDGTLQVPLGNAAEILGGTYAHDESGKIAYLILKSTIYEVHNGNKVIKKSKLGKKKQDTIDEEAEMPGEAVYTSSGMQVPIDYLADELQMQYQTINNLLLLFTSDTADAATKIEATLKKEEI
ncbi:MAG: hypothetical protein LBJ83_03085 [Oscillospiraceae bacterium]|jgi:hypothetical protein|nr:hypothetical protein [Oscillospiraceae bacterium]